MADPLKVFNAYKQKFNKSPTKPTQLITFSKSRSDLPNINFKQARNILINHHHTNIKNNNKPPPPLRQKDKLNNNDIPQTEPKSDLKVGQSLDVLYNDQWYPAKVVKKTGKNVKVTYDEWDEYSDEWIARSSRRISQIAKNDHKKQKEINEDDWKDWNNNDVVAWISSIENEKFAMYQAFIKQIKESDVTGDDIPQMNDFILRSFKLVNPHSRQLLLQNIQRLTAKMSVQNKKNNKDGDSLCVVCNDGDANHIMIPCGHIAVCLNCVKDIQKSNKCPFCGNKITNVIKCFHVGV